MKRIHRVRSFGTRLPSRRRFLLLASLASLGSTPGGSVMAESPKVQAIKSAIELAGTLVQMTMSNVEASSVETVVIRELGSLRPNEKVIGRYYVDSLSGEPTYWNYQTSLIEGWFYITSERIAYHPVGRGNYWALQQKIDVPISQIHSVKVSRQFVGLWQPTLTFSIRGMTGDHATQSLFALRSSRMAMLNTMSMEEMTKLSQALAALASGVKLKANSPRKKGSGKSVR